MKKWILARGLNTLRREQVFNLRRMNLFIAAILLGLLASCKTVVPVYDNTGDLTSFEVKRVVFPKNTRRGGYRPAYTNPYRSYNRTKVWNKIMYPNTWSR